MKGRKLIGVCLVAIFPIVLFGQGQGVETVSDNVSAFSIFSASFFSYDHFSKKSTTALFDFKAMRPNTFYPVHKVTGIFCRMEHRIEATSNFAPRFRLGSVNYTDWMEGKKSFLSRLTK